MAPEWARLTADVLKGIAWPLVALIFGSMLVGPVRRFLKALASRAHDDELLEATLPWGSVRSKRAVGERLTELAAREGVPNAEQVTRLLVTVAADHFEEWWAETPRLEESFSPPGTVDPERPRDAVLRWVAAAGAVLVGSYELFLNVWQELTHREVANGTPPTEAEFESARRNAAQLRTYARAIRHLRHKYWF